MHIRGKGAMVVGGASGMARATAEALREAGADVAILDLPQSSGAEVAAEAGVAAMMLPMARDLGTLGIRSVAIAPSLFETGMTSLAPPEMQAELTRDNAFPRRMGRPEEYAQLALAIVRNPMLNGSCIR